MSYKLSSRSLLNLEGVHPDLQRVVKRSIEITEYDFGITCGVRDIETQRQYVHEGKSKTMNSKHLVQEDGWGHAIDFAIYMGGVVWDIKYYRKVIQAFFTAAIEGGVQIKSGGLWESFVDGPHIELNKAYYKL